MTLPFESLFDTQGEHDPNTKTPNKHNQNVVLLRQQNFITVVQKL